MAIAAAMMVIVAAAIVVALAAEHFAGSRVEVHFNALSGSVVALHFNGIGVALDLHNAKAVRGEPLFKGAERQWRGGLLGLGCGYGWDGEAKARCGDDMADDHNEAPS